MLNNYRLLLLSFGEELFPRMDFVYIKFDVTSVFHIIAMHVIVNLQHCFIAYLYLCKKFHTRDFIKNYHFFPSPPPTPPPPPPPPV
jgi:hypothetical protein